MSYLIEILYLHLLLLLSLFLLGSFGLSRTTSSGRLILFVHMSVRVRSQILHRCQGHHACRCRIVDIAYIVMWLIVCPSLRLLVLRGRDSLRLLFVVAGFLKGLDWSRVPYVTLDRLRQVILDVRIVELSEVEGADSKAEIEIDYRPYDKSHSQHYDCPLHGVRLNEGCVLWGQSHQS